MCLLKKIIENEFLYVLTLGKHFKGKHQKTSFAQSREGNKINKIEKGKGQNDKDKIIKRSFA